MSTATFVRSAVNPGVISSAEPMETDEAFYETVHGQRVEMPPMSVRAAIVASRISIALGAFARPNRLGEVFTELLIHVPLPEDASRDRRPDVAFFAYPRSPSTSTQLPNVNAWDVIPDLAIEVTSPSDRAEAQREKVLDYFRAGVRLVWVVYPNLRLIDVYETPTTIRVFGPDGTLAGDPVLPGFELSFADLFAPFAPPSA
jgi:Uma2 family endonuclease